ncbi:MAG: hypothetical protein Q9227_006327 [Pyrenula ochraceoflavens]
MAFTDNVKTTRKVSLASQITVCQVKSSAIHFHGKFDESQGFRWKRSLAALGDIMEKWFEPQIDGLANFPVTMLHELAHTRFAGQDGLGGGLTDDKVGYGWKKIHDGVQTGHTNAGMSIPQNNVSECKTSELRYANADSYAYFGLLVHMMKNAANPQTVDVNGAVQKLAAVVQRLMRKALAWFA